MKNRFKNKNDNAGSEVDDYEEYDDSVEIDDNSTEVASSKGSKMLLIVASAILVTVVLYFFFFRGGQSNQTASVNIADIEGTVDKVEAPILEEEPDELFYEEEEIISKPDIPEVPKLPELPNLPPALKDGPDVLSNLPDFIEIPNDGGDVDPVPQIETIDDSPTIPNPPSNNTQPNNESEDVPIDPRRSPIIAISGGSGPTLGVGYENSIINLKEDPINKLDATSSSSATATAIKDRVHTIAQGKMMTAVLETAINTELPGTIRGILSRDVYGESGSDVLIPKGSRLYGTYTSQVLRGQGRVEISWTRLIRPDGVDIAITFNAADQFGRAGLEGDVDNKYGTVIANSLLTSVLAVGGAIVAEQLSGGGNTTTTTAADGSSATTGKASDQVIADVSKTIVDTVATITTNAIDLSPVIRVPQGTKMTIVVNADMTLPPLRGNK